MFNFISVLHPQFVFQTSSRDFYFDNQPIEVRCILDVKPGYLNLTQDFLVFFPKPIAAYEFRNIEMINFVDRGAGRFFTLEVYLKPIGEIKRFRHINKEIKAFLIEYFRRLLPVTHGHDEDEDDSEYDADDDFVRACQRS